VTTPRILISGASIAGPALAFWLNERGWATTVVERFDALRDTGQNIDIRGAAREVVRRMGLEDAIRAASTGELGTEFVGADGGVLASFPAGRSDSGGPTAELEILRPELSRLLYERTRGRTEYVFGDRIEALDEQDAGVTVTFRHGRPRTFDVVVIAEGFRSRTRSLLFPDPDVRDLGVYIAYLTVPRTDTDTGWWRWYNAPRGRVVSLRPDNQGTTRALLSFRSDVGGLDELAPADQARILRSTFRDAGWETPRVLDALDEDTLYFDALGQVRLPAWSRGRVGLVGDAAYCPSAVSGMGTSVALVGAYVLAAELAAAGDHRGFARYEAALRPYVERAQKLPPGTPRLAHPRSRAGVAVLRTAMRLAGSPPVKRLGALAGGVSAPAAERLDLSRYPASSG
jgi:2-polyprenyl-6-methoxyphenol hydroxylase-like FAD-dependent oxidoreductase